MRLKKANTLKRVLGGVLGVVLLAGGMWVLRRSVEGNSLHDVMQALRKIPMHRLVLSLLASVGSYLALIGYDVVALRSLGRRVRMSGIALAGFTGWAIGNSMPLSLVVGGAVRYRFRRVTRLSARTTTAIVVRNVVTYILGLLAAMGFVFTLRPEAIPSLVSLPLHTTLPLGVASLLLLAAILTWRMFAKPGKRWRTEIARPTPWKLSVAQITVSLFDWGFSGLALYVLLPPIPTIGFLGLEGIFLLGQLAALIGEVPGGLGVFEALMFALLKHALPGPVILGALVAYRVIYFILPLIVALGILAVNEVRELRRKRGKL